MVGLCIGGDLFNFVLFLRVGDVAGVGSCVVSKRVATLLWTKVSGLEGKELSAR